MLYLGLFILFLGLLLLWQARRQRQAGGLPGGRLVYSDTGAWGARLEQPLYAAELGLTGKPDYLVEQGPHLIPVEVKSSRGPRQAPYDSHIYQVAAYCLLVEAIYEKRPPYGLLHYTDGEHSQTYAIDFTPQLEAELRVLLGEMQAGRGRKAPERSHDSPARCQSCGFRAVCDQVLKRR